MQRLDRLSVFGAHGFPASAERRFHPSEPVVMHTHDFLELAYVTGGDALHVTSSGSLPIECGTLIAIRPGQRHTYEECRDLEVFNMALGAELLRRELLWTLGHPDLARFLLRGGTSIQPLPASAGDALVEWLDRLGTQAAPAGSAAGAVALGLVCCALGEMAKGRFGGPQSRRWISSPVREALRLMAESPAAEWTMTELARRTAVSVAHLHRLFAAEIGGSPMAWLARTRIELAASMLIQGNLSIAEIARRTGWSDPNHFSKRFRQLTGDTPTDHRSRFRPKASAAR